MRIPISRRAASPFSILALFLGVLLFSSADGEAAMVRGRLLHSNGFPAAFIAVRVFAPNLGPSGFSYSGNDGMYYLNGIPPQSYTLEVWVSNAYVLRFTINVIEPVTDIAPIGVP